MNNTDSDLEEKINVAAYFLSQKNYPYDKLCWLLAERQLLAQGDPGYAVHERIREKAAEIYHNSPPYDILVWLIAELDILLEDRYSK
jgi:hypothetical protein